MNTFKKFLQISLTVEYFIFFPGVVLVHFKTIHLNETHYYVVDAQRDEATHRKIHIASNILKEDVIEGCMYLCVGACSCLFIGFGIWFCLASVFFYSLIFHCCILRLLLKTYGRLRRTISHSISACYVALSVKKF